MLTLNWIIRSIRISTLICTLCKCIHVLITACTVESVTAGSDSYMYMYVRKHREVHVVCSVLPSILEACRPNKPSVQTFFDVGMGALMWLVAPPRFFSLPSCLKVCLGRTLVCTHPYYYMYLLCAYLLVPLSFTFQSAIVFLMQLRAMEIERNKHRECSKIAVSLLNPNYSYIGRHLWYWNMHSAS